MDPVVKPRYDTECVFRSTQQSLAMTGMTKYKLYHNNYG
nr:hypothetical protein [Rickettsia endosymbiont of Ixodes pacificus]